MRMTPDDQDREILTRRAATLNAIQEPRCGDYVRFTDGVLRRISYIWRDEHDAPFSVQTSDGGSYYLGDGYVSMSGGLHTGVPPATLTRTEESRDGSVWFFHHDRACADNGVDLTIPFRVYTCSMEATL